MPTWALCTTGGLLALVAILAILLKTRATVYFVHPFGFSALSGRENPAHQASREQLGVVIERLLPGDLFDMLWVSRSGDRCGGLMVTLQDGSPVMTVHFKTNSEQAELAAFREAVKDQGFSAEEDSNGFNGGLGEDFRITTLEYRLTGSSQTITNFVEVALKQLQPQEASFFFVSASSYSDGPGKGSGLKVRFPEDPIGGILNPR